MADLSTVLSTGRAASSRTYIHAYVRIRREMCIKSRSDEVRPGARWRVAGRSFACTGHRSRVVPLGSPRARSAGGGGLPAYAIMRAFATLSPLFLDRGVSIWPCPSSIRPAPVLPTFLAAGFDMRAALLLAAAAGAASQFLPPNSAYPIGVVPTPVQQANGSYTTVSSLTGTFSADGTSNPATALSSSQYGALGGVGCGCGS